MISFVARFLLVICILYFVIGLPCALVGWIDQAVFDRYAGYVGAAASIFGLLALATRQSVRLDVDGTQEEVFRKISAALTDVRKAEVELAKKNSELTEKERDVARLKQQEQTLRALIQKASEIMFLREIHQRRVTDILDHLKDNPSVYEKLRQVEDIEAKMGVLNEQLERDDQFEVVRRVLKKMQSEHEDRQRLPADPLEAAVMLALRPFELVTQMIRRI